MTYQELWRSLTPVYDNREAQAVSRLVLEERFSLSWADVLVGKTVGDGEAELRDIQQRLLRGEPVQYVLGEATFGARRFRVSPGVLIPRPETYELCQWLIGQTPCDGGAAVLDIGTGSGCIACTIAAELPQASVTAWDVSDAALAIARENAKRTGVHVSFEHVDVLAPPPSLSWDLIVSNPPYICEQEKSQMAPGVLNHEPHLALFVPDDDPLLFYRAIADYACRSLTAGGSLYFEINPLYVAPLEQLLRDSGFTGVVSREDQFGKMRFTKAIQP